MWYSFYILIFCFFGGYFLEYKIKNTFIKVIFMALCQYAGVRENSVWNFEAVLRCLIFFRMTLMFAATDNQITAVIFGIICIVGTPIIYYWAGYLWFYGFMTVKSWFVKLGIGVAGTSAAVGKSMAISYLLGGKRTARLTGIIWLIALAISLSIGFYVGLYNFFKIRAEVKSLGICGPMWASFPAECARIQKP